ncbi:hypothetical protein WG901_10455 [Novosphingobium sp. PS1R-30]|uniref:DUF4124 domain-containing protein n=1 Tax=Novosphingobium anseongense TaxID=3133436 RepID=A0ABU8RVN0_9SPHN
MSRFSLIAAATLTSILLLPAAPAMAQSPDEKVNLVIVYGQDACPQGKDDEITVCARKEESERYRIPEALRGSDSPRNDAWNNKVLAYETVGRTGTQSCSPVGAGGALGCTQQLINRAYAEKGQDPSIRFGELIQAEREKRLSTLDAEAADTQVRVEEAERQYDERKRREAEGGTPVPAGN